jgi:tetratricopeptide (TPR) repeat protein
VEQVDPTPVNVQTALLNRLLREHDNLRAVLDWLLERGELSVGMRLAYHLRPFWEPRGLVAEGAEWLERLLARAEPPSTPEELEAQALHYLANPLAQLGKFDPAEAMHVERLAINRANDAQVGVLVDLINLGDLRCYQGRYDEALAIEQEALEISRSLAEREPSLALVLANLGETHILMDHPAEAKSFLLESQRVIEEYDQPVHLALYNLGRAGWRLGSWTEALGYLKRATQLSRGQDDTAALIQELCVIAGIALDRRGFLNPSSHSFLERCIPDCRPINSSRHCVLNIQTQYRAVTTVDRQEYTNTF